MTKVYIICKDCGRINDIDSILKGTYVIKNRVFMCNPCGTYNTIGTSLDSDIYDSKTKLTKEELFEILL